MVTATDLVLNANSPATLRQALAKIRRQKPSTTTIRWSYNKKARDGDLPVIEVPEGTVLMFAIYSDIPFLHLGSGRMVFRALSSWGNSLTVHDGAEAHITTAPGIKVTINIGDHATVTTDIDGNQRYDRLRYWPRTPIAEVETTRGFPSHWL